MQLLPPSVPPPTAPPDPRLNRSVLRSTLDSHTETILLVSSDQGVSRPRGGLSPNLKMPNKPKGFPFPESALQPNDHILHTAQTPFFPTPFQPLDESQLWPIENGKCAVSSRWVSNPKLGRFWKECRTDRRQAASHPHQRSYSEPSGVIIRNTDNCLTQAGVITLPPLTLCKRVSLSLLSQSSLSPGSTAVDARPPLRCLNESPTAALQPSVNNLQRVTAWRVLEAQTHSHRPALCWAYQNQNTHSIRITGRGLS
jgi:hypothetical protein